MGPRAEGAIPELRNLLAERRVCRTAAFALARIGPGGVTALVAALPDQRPHVKEVAAEALARAGSRAVPALIPALRHRDWAVRGAAAVALGRIGPQAVAAVPALVEMLRDRDLTVTIEVTTVSTDPPRKAGEIESVNFPLISVRDAAEYERAQAAYALARLGPPGVAALVEAAYDRTRKVRPEAAVVLARATYTAMAEHLATDKSEHPFPFTVLALLGQHRTLLEAGRDLDAIARRQAAEALARVTPPPRVALHPLMWALKDPDHLVRMAAADALARLGPGARPAIPSLIEALRDPRFIQVFPNGPSEWGVRASVVRALLAVGPEGEERLLQEGLPLLIAGLKDPNDFNRAHAALALRPLGPGPARPSRPW
jgi:HEAT repeat protein